LGTNTTVAKLGTGALGLSGASSPGGVAVAVNNPGGAVGGTGYSLLVEDNNLNMLGITGLGHVIPLSSASKPTTPLAGAFATGFQTGGNVNTSSVNGSDLSFQVVFTPGGACATINPGTALVTIALGQAYQSSQVTCHANYGVNPGTAGEQTSMHCGLTAPGTLVIYNDSSFTPTVSPTVYTYSVTTFGAGATY
jgi:hypothetical protein